MRVAAVQSSYIPWKGYFDIIALADTFVFYDDVQYSTESWRNRNLIVTPRGRQWLTIPVRTRHRREQRIDEVQIADSRWSQRHWHSLQTYYGGASAFGEVAPRLQELYRRAEDLDRLVDVNRLFTVEICGWLGISTTFASSGDLDLLGNRTERLVELCRKLGATQYLTGPSASAYLDRALFDSSGVSVEWMSYEGYPEYRQRAPEFTSHVSILDLLFNEGLEAAPRFMLFSRRDVHRSPARHHSRG